jgi:small subunit ribosomal protein S6e
MAKFKLIVSHPDGKSQVTEVEGPKAQPLIGKQIDETVDGMVAGLSGSELKITGGSDKDGFPMRKSVHGGVRVSSLLSGGVGFHPKQDGQQRRKRVRGNVITEDIVQVNLKIVGKEEKASPATKK